MGNFLSDLVQKRNIKTIENSINVSNYGNREEYPNKTKTSSNFASNPIINGVFKGAKRIQNKGSQISYTLQMSGKRIVKSISNKKRPQKHHRNNQQKNNIDDPSSKYDKRDVTLLWGTSTWEEHCQQIQMIVTKARSSHLKGALALHALGFEYRRNVNEKHKQSYDKSNNESENFENDSIDEYATYASINSSRQSLFSRSSVSTSDTTVAGANLSSQHPSCAENISVIPVVHQYGLSQGEKYEPEKGAIDEHDVDYPCNNRLQLYHLQSKTFINEGNRKHFIADGEMYDQIARFCQEVVHEMMIHEADLEWFTICNDTLHNDDNNNIDYSDEQCNEQIRVLISKNLKATMQKSFNEKNLPDTNERHAQTLVIITGKGKVRAGIFSRQHLLTTGMESSTAFSFVREAVKRNMNIVMLDPNARGDEESMNTFEKSLSQLFSFIENVDHENHDHLNNSYYVLAHSQGGAQLVRFLLQQKQYNLLLSQINAIAFTDSTHNIQWVKENHILKSFLTSERCVYFKSSNVEHDHDWENHKTGDHVEPDEFWEHRFGNIKTIWAGTKEHSLMNWEARHLIWDHFELCI